MFGYCYLSLGQVGYWYCSLNLGLLGYCSRVGVGEGMMAGLMVGVHVGYDHKLWCDVEHHNSYTDILKGTLHSDVWRRDSCNTTHPY
jgi:hypothetical protein